MNKFNNLTTQSWCAYYDKSLFKGQKITYNKITINTEKIFSYLVLSSKILTKM